MSKSSTHEVMVLITDIFGRTLERVIYDDTSPDSTVFVVRFRFRFESETTPGNYTSITCHLVLMQASHSLNPNDKWDVMVDHQLIQKENAREALTEAINVLSKIKVT